MKKTEKNTTNDLGLANNSDFQMYVKFEAKKGDDGKFRAVILHQVGNDERLEALLCVEESSLDFIVDEGFPESYYIQLIGHSNVQGLIIDQYNQFGYVRNYYSKNPEFLEETDDCILAFAETNHDVYHLFVSKGNYQSAVEFHQKLRNNELNEEIAKLLGDDRDVIAKIQHAVIDEHEQNRIREIGLFQAYVKIKRSLSGAYSFPLLLNGVGYYSKLTSFNGPHSRMTFRLVDGLELDYILILTDSGNKMEFPMYQGFGVLGGTTIKNGKGETILVYEDLVENTYHFFITHERISENSSQLLNLFKNGQLKLEIERIIGPNCKVEIRDWWVQFRELSKHQRELHN
jgi:hypothetical protein